jgi:alpha-L-fucosidase 2
MISLRALLAYAAALLGLTTAGAQTHPSIDSLAACNVVWDSPSADSFGSMPLGNGDIGINVWMEPNGDLLFYIAKVDAYDAGHLLPKLGRVRLRTEPALDVTKFKQSLLLQEAAVEIQAGDSTFRVWVDANAPVIRVQGQGRNPRKASLTAETLRPWKNAADPLPATGTAALVFHDCPGSLAWCYRNQSSAWAANFADQNTSEMVAKFKDPILHRTSGCALSAKGFKRTSPDSLATPQPVTTIDASVRVLTNQALSPEAWIQEALMPMKSDWNAHLAYWKSFWNRSYIFIPKAGEGTYNLDQFRFTQFPQSRDAYIGQKEIPATQNAYQITQRYALERFCQAIASRGAVPPQFNGSLFTMDMPVGVMGFDNRKGEPVSPDGRDWSKLSFMWQNTRHPYWAMANRGDYDTVVPGMQFVRDGLDIAKDRTRKLYGIDGGVIFEASWYYNVGVFPFNGIPGHLKFHQLPTIELPAIMAETYAHTRDKAFLRDVLLPCAEEGLKFYFNRFTKTDASGKMLMEGVGCAETYQGVTNPATEIGCMKYLLDHLLSFPIDNQRRATFAKWRAMLPDVPTRRIRGMDLLAVGDVYDPGRTDCETPELYSIYPFRQVGLGTPETLAMARQSFHVRNSSLDGTADLQPVETGGWQSAPVQAACLGLAREAARLASISFHDQFIHWTGNCARTPDGKLIRGSLDAPGSVIGDPKSGLPFPHRPRARFPAFWETKMDGTPDNDHGANAVNTLQAMLLQSHMGKIHLLPAWPEEWDVSFKLTAEKNTTVEGIYQNGRITELKVTPESRRKDIVDHSTPEARIKTLIDVACADRNWLFNLPHMLDGLPIPGPVTGPWIEKFGESISNTRGTPWPGCTFRDHILYIHGKNPVPQIPAKIVNQSALSDSLVRIEYDQALEPIIRASVSAGSLSAGKSGTTIDLGETKTIDRLEFTIDIPNYHRGQAKSFRLEVLQPGGQWTTAHQGNIYGIIYSKRFPPVSASQVRLTIDAPVTRFDLFEP